MYLHQSTEIPLINEQVYHPMMTIFEWGQQFSRCHQELDQDSDSYPTLHCLSYAVEDATHPLIYCTTIESFVNNLWEDIAYIQPQLVRHYHVGERLTFLFYVDELGHYHAVLKCPDGQEHTLSWLQLDQFSNP